MSKPQINRVRADDGSFFERLARTTEQAQIRRQQLEAEEHEGYNFKPTINRVSEEAAHQRQNRSGSAGLPATTRLYEEGRESKEQLEARMQMEKEHRERSSGPYHPRTNPRSGRILDQVDEAGLYKKDFVQRQEYLASLKKEQLDELRHAIINEERGPGGVNGSSTHYPARIHYDQIQEQVERLYQESRVVRDTAKAELRIRLQQEQCPFAPQLSTLSESISRKKINRSVPVYERLHSQSHRSSSVPPPEETASNGPNTSRQTISREDARSFYQRQLKKQEERDIRVEQSRVQSSLKDGLNCSFRPVTNAGGVNDSQRSIRRASSAHSPKIEIKGLEEFTNRQQKAKELKEEQSARREALGRGKECNGPNYTVVVPFNLTAVSKPTRRKTGPTTSSIHPSRSHVDPYSQSNPPHTSKQQMALSQLPGNVAATVQKYFGGAAAQVLNASAASRTSTNRSGAW